jgi:hypothetical protein
MYTQTFAPVAHSIGASAAFAALPLLILFVLLGVLRVQARWAALASLAVSMAVAILVYGMPANQTASGALEGAAIGFFPIIWIGINAIWLFKLTQESGHADVLRRALARVSADQRVQAVLIVAGSARRRRRTSGNLCGVADFDRRRAVEGRSGLPDRGYQSGRVRRTRFAHYRARQDHPFAGP